MEVKQSLAFVLILLNLACQAKADCDAPTGFKNAKLLSDLSDQPAVFEDKHELLYECNIGFRPATGRGSRCWNGRWTEIRCERIFCKWLPAPDNGRRLDSNAYVGEYTTFACNEGYQLIGYKTLLCRADGKWRPSDPPVCKPVSCGRLPWLTNGEAFQATRDGNLNLYGSVVKLSCKFGFDLIKGSKERRCQADGTWSGTQPVCEEPTCPKLEPFYNGVIYYQNDDVISLYHVAEIECNDGSDVFPEGTRFVTCVEGNTWDVNNITCERHLTISPPSHMKLYTGQGRYRPRITSSRRLKSRTSLHIECEYKHELVDGKTNKYYEVNSLQVRIFNGTVVPELPLCRKERCNLVADHCSFMDTDRNKLVGKVEHNTVVVKMCDPDFEFEPSDKRKEPRQRSTCNQGVIDFPRCIPKRCEIPADRRAKLYGKNYKAGDLIQNSQTVERTCSGKRELFYPETQIYEENSNIFSSTCKIGVWSNGVFPKCKEKRCNIVTDHCSFMDTDGNDLVGKVEHNTVVVKKCDPGFEFEPSDKRKEPNQKSTCDRGVIDFPRCTPKRCEIPHDRHARIGEDIYTADELVDSEEQVVVDCREREEVYYPESKTYAKTFTTTCRYGLWSDDKFPICKEERCSSPNERDGTRFLLDEKVVQNGDKLEHGTILTKSCNKGYEDKTNLPTKCSSGSWINDEPCTGKPCTLPAIEHTRDNEIPKQLAHDKQVRVECKNSYDMIGSDVANQNIKTNCNKGNLAPSLDNIKCVPKGCSGTSNANVYRATDSGDKEEEPASSFDHEEYAIVKCHDHYVLTQDSKPVSDRKSKTTRCMFGKWEPEYACEKDTCHVDVPENGKLWIKTANKTKQGKTLMKNGYTGIFNCDQNYTLDNDTIVQHTDGYPITCVGNKLNTTLPTCVKNVPDSEESADMIYDNYGVQMGEAMESPAYEKSSITLTIPETTAAAAATKDATISSATTDVPLASTTPFSESPSTTKEEFHYDYPGVDEVKSEETCPNPANGRLVRSYLSYYNVVCDDGYELDVVENDDDYKCSNGKWMSKNFGFEAECNEKTHFELEVKVGNSQWAGSFGQLNVTILSEQGEIIHRMAFEKPDFKALHAGHLYTLLSSTTGETRKVGHLKLSLGPGNGGSNDNLVIDHIRLTIQRAADNIKEEYDFSSVGWLDKNQAKFVRPDMGVFRLKYRLGDAYTADSSDTFHISFEGSLGRTPFYLMSSGRRYKGQTYYKVIDGEYVGQIYAVTIKNDRYVKNDMQIDYIQLTVSHEDKEEKYLFRNVGWIGSLKEIKSEITADQPEMPSCRDDFDVSPGWVGTKLPPSEFSQAEHVKSDEECKNLCRRDGNCKVAAVSGYVHLKNLTCKLVYTNQKSAFQFRDNGSKHRLYTRKC